MEPGQFALGHYLDGNVQLHIPPYQRTYEWGVDRWTDLWRDIAHQAREREAKKKVPPHFMGAMILEPRDAPTGTSAQSYAVVDGQQRILTLFILASALRDHEALLAKKPVEAVNSLNTIKSPYGADAPRLVVKRQDTMTMDRILRGDFLAEIPESEYGSQLAQAYRFFRYLLWQGKSSLSNHVVPTPPRPSRAKHAPPKGSFEPWGKPATLSKRLDSSHLYNVLVKGLRLLELRMDPTDEESSVIFETMNSKSTPPRQFDLLRNSVFVRMPNPRDAFYDGTWKRVEDVLSGVSYRSLRDEPEEQFFYEYMISIGAGAVSKDKLHKVFLDEVIERLGYAVTPATESKFESQFAMPIAEAACVYPIAVGKKARVGALGRDWRVTASQHQLIQEILSMSGGPPVPLVLAAILDRHDPHANMSDDDLTAILLLIQSYLVRSMLAGAPFSPMRSTFMQIASDVVRPMTPARVRSALRKQAWLSDEVVLKAVPLASLKKYGSASIMPILRGIEKQLAGSGAHPMPFGAGQEEYSIEHIYPQTDNIGAQWDQAIRKWKATRDDMDERRYVLGNLTAVTGYDNKKNGIKPFLQKAQLIKACAPLRIHESITQPSTKTWAPKVIDKRSRELARAALKRWPGP